MEKETAVRWLVDKLTNGHYLDEGMKQDIINQAKEMEKQQIIDARQDGYECTYAEYGETPKCYLDGSNEQYYNETFKQQEQ
jgi:hypothetical protein